MRGSLTVVLVCMAMPACVSPDRLVLPEGVDAASTKLLVWKTKSGPKLRVFAHPEDFATLNLKDDSQLWLIAMEGSPEFYQLSLGTNIDWGRRQIVPSSVHQLTKDGWLFQGTVVPSGFGLPDLDLESCLAEQGCLRNPICENRRNCTDRGPAFCSKSCEVGVSVPVRPLAPVCPSGWTPQSGVPFCVPPVDDRHACAVETWRPFLGESCESIWAQTLPALPAAPIVYVDDRAVGGPGCGDMASPCASFDELGAPTGDRVIMMSGRHPGTTWSGPGFTVIRGAGAGAELTGVSEVLAAGHLIIQQVSVFGSLRGGADSRLEVVQSSVHSAQGPAIESQGSVVIEGSRVSALLSEKNCAASEVLRNCVTEAAVDVRDASELIVSNSEVHGYTAILTRGVAIASVTGSRIIAARIFEPTGPISPVAGIVFIDTPTVRVERSAIYSAYLSALYIDTKGLDAKLDVEIEDVLTWREVLDPSPLNPSDDSRPFVPHFYLIADSGRFDHTASLKRVYSENIGTLFRSNEITRLLFEHVFVDNGRGGLDVTAFQRVDVRVQDVAMDLNRYSGITIGAEGVLDLNRVHLRAPRTIEDGRSGGFAGVSGSRKDVPGVINSLGFAGGVPALIGRDVEIVTARTAAIRGFFESVDFSDSAFSTTGDWIFDRSDGLPQPFAVTLRNVVMSSDVAGLRIPDVSLDARQTTLSLGPNASVGPAVCGSLRRSVEFRNFTLIHTHPEEGLLWFFGSEGDDAPLLSDGVLSLGRALRPPEPATRLARKIAGCTTGPTQDETPVDLRIHNVELRGPEQ